MNHPTILSRATLMAVIAFLASISIAQDASSFPYMNTKLSPEERAYDLVHRMTLEEGLTARESGTRRPSPEHSFVRLVERSLARRHF